MNLGFFGKQIRFRCDIINNYKWLTGSGAFSYTAEGFSGLTEDNELAEVVIKVRRNLVDELIGPFVTWVMEDKCKNLKGDSKDEEYEILKQLRENIENHPTIQYRMREDLLQFPCPIENIEILAEYDKNNFPIWLNYGEWCRYDERQRNTL